MAHLGLRAFDATDVTGALGAAIRAAESTERGSLIASAVVEHMRAAYIVLPAPAGILARLAHVRAIGLDPGIAGRVYEHRFEQLVREGQVAPAFLLCDYSLRRRRAKPGTRQI